MPFFSDNIGSSTPFSTCKITRTPTCYIGSAPFSICDISSYPFSICDNSSTPSSSYDISTTPFSSYDTGTSPVSSDIPAASQPEASSTDARSPEGSVKDAASYPDTMTLPSYDTSTYNKRCPKCHMDYRYQEWRDGLHNFNDHVILTLELCLYMRYNLQNHVSVSRLISCLESFRGQKFPAINIIFQAYCHFEALNNTEYSYSCVNCGFSPAVVMMDIHRNRVSKLEVSELETPPEDFDGQHNIEDFWDSVHLEMISQGFFPRSNSSKSVQKFQC
eukprot:superscaffoldBa00003458_g16984